MVAALAAHSATQTALSLRHFPSGEEVAESVASRGVGSHGTSTRTAPSRTIMADDSWVGRAEYEEPAMEHKITKTMKNQDAGHDSNVGPESDPMAGKGKAQGTGEASAKSEHEQPAQSIPISGTTASQTHRMSRIAG